MSYTMDDYQDKLIGTGLQVPDTFNRASGEVNYNNGIERINQSIRHILGTRIGERFFLPDFGSRLYELIFEPNDYILEDLIKLYVNDALEKWEPRIEVLNVTPTIIKGGNTVPISISYTLINTDVTYNYVYPFNREVYTL